MERLVVSEVNSLFPPIFGELSYGAKNLRRSLEQKNKVNVEEAQKLLFCLKNSLSEEKPYFSGNELPHIVRHIDSGFHNACYLFKNSADKQEWVIKVGHDKSPIREQFDPSTPEYAQRYSKNLEIQRKVFGNQLPNLIPEPQEIFHVQGVNCRSTTVIIEPYISPFDWKIKLNQDEQKQIRNEFKMLKTLAKTMRDNYGITLDFLRARGKSGHLVITSKADGAHLIMLDNGVYDEKRDPTPVWHLLNRVYTKISTVTKLG